MTIHRIETSADRQIARGMTGPRKTPARAVGTIMPGSARDRVLAIAGVPKAEFARTLIERAVFGDLSMLRRVARPLTHGRWDEDSTNVGSRGGR